MKIGIIVSLCFAPAIGAAQIYGDAAGCAWFAGKPEITDTLYLYDQTSIRRAESVCPVTGTLQAGSGATVLTVECNGEGSTWEDYYMVKTTGTDDTLIIHPEAFPEFATEIKICTPQ